MRPGLRVALPKGLSRLPVASLVAGQSEGGEVDVVDVAALAASLRLLDERLTGDDVGAILVGAAIGGRDLRRDRVGGVGRVGDVEGRAGLHGVDAR